MSIQRSYLPLWKKYDIIVQFNTRNNTNVAKLARELKIPRTTLTSILKNKDTIISDFEAGRRIESKRKRKHNFDDVDEPLLKWFRYAQEKNIPVSGEMLVVKAQEFAQVSGCEDIEKLDINWINRWKAREHIVRKKLHRDTSETNHNQSGMDEWQKYRLPALLKQFKAKDIFNAGEAELHYQCLPDRIHVFENEKCTGGKLFKERLSVFVAVSMIGEKLPPVVIGKLASPDCFRHVEKLPLPYESNKEGRMNATIFAKWVKTLDLQMRKRSRTIALVLDNSTAHSDTNCLTNIKLVFFPPDANATIQPINAGIVCSLKLHYRHNLEKLRLLAFEEKIDFNINVLERMRLLSQAWDSVSEAKIKTCFKKANFTRCIDSAEEQENDAEEDVWERLKALGLIPATGDVTKHFKSDKELLKRETITEKSSISNLQATNIEEEEDDISEEDVQPAVLSPMQALTAFRQLDRYLRNSGVNQKLLHSLTELHQYLLDKAVSI